MAIMNCAGRVRGHHEHASGTGCLTRSCRLTVQQTLALERRIEFLTAELAKNVNRIVPIREK